MVLLDAPGAPWGRRDDQGRHLARRGGPGGCAVPAGAGRYGVVPGGLAPGEATALNESSAEVLNSWYWLTRSVAYSVT